MNTFTITLLSWVVAALVASPASGQIVNTLRGFDDEERGWSGGVLGSMALADGNTEYVEFEADAKVQYQTQRNRWRAIGMGMRRTAQGVKVAESRVGHLRHNYRFLPWLSSVAFLQGQYNPFVRIETRVVFGGGARFEVLQEKAWESAVGVTAMHETEEFTDHKGEFTTDYRFSCFVTLYRAKKEGVDLDLWVFYQPLIDNFSDVRTSGAASIRVDITGGLYFVSAYVVSGDTDPPQGVEKLDQRLRSGLGWEF